MSIHKIYVRDEVNPKTAMELETVFLLEGDVDIHKLMPIFVNPKYQNASFESELTDVRGPIFEVRYKKSVVDPELNSLLVAAHALGEHGLLWGRVGKRYQFIGISQDEAWKIMQERFFNPVVQEIVDAGEKLETLKPTGIPDAVKNISLSDMEDDDLIKLSDTRSWNAPLAQLQVVRQHEQERGKTFTDAELEIIFTSWSDHCYHTTWKGLGLLDRLKEATRRINHPRVISAFHDNAGGIDFDGEHVVILKGETHNHPTSIAPYGGVATKHGGVIRDVIGFGKGGYPIGGTTIMGVGLKSTTPEGCLDPERILRESIEATADYSNQMGIPILHALYREHPGYVKCFALGHSVGIIPKKYALKENPRPGDAALLIGGKTGRDGIHGATASSGAATSEDAEKNSATVQIGDPITQRKFMEAIPRLRDEDCIRSLTDLGAGGIAGAAGEMGAETGIRLNLNKVLLKDTSLTAWEILLSESQERMLLVIPKDKLRKARRILRMYAVEYAKIGHFTSTKKLEAYWHKKKVVGLDMGFLWGACPIPELPVARPAAIETSRERPADVGGFTPHIMEAEALVQFDKTVQGRTVVEPLVGKTPTHISVISPTHTNRGIATAVSYNPDWASLPPREYVRAIFFDAVSRVTEAGADKKNIFLCSNFYTPKPTPEWNWYLQDMVRELADLTEKYGIPVITGKDSSSGTFITDDGERIDVPPTFSLMAMGIVEDIESHKEWYTVMYSEED